MTAEAGFDWQPLILALITGSGGGLLGAWLQHTRQTKADTLATEVARLSAKKDLRALADEAIGEVVQTLREENKSIREENAEIKDRITRIEKRNDELVQELATAHRNLRATEESLLEAERQLRLLEQARSEEIAAKDRTITMLQDKIEILQNTILELRAQVEKLTQALSDGVKESNGDD